VLGIPGRIHGVDPRGYSRFATLIVLRRLREKNRSLQPEDYFRIDPFILAACVWEGDPPETASPTEKRRFQALYEIACAVLDVPVHAADLRPAHKRSAEEIDDLAGAYSWIVYAVSMRETELDRHMTELLDMDSVKKLHARQRKAEAAADKLRALQNAKRGKSH
jgi:hypothetical protein